MHYKPLSMWERRALAAQLRREAAEKIKEAERIEEGCKADEDEWLEALNKAIAKQGGMVPNAKVSEGENER